MLVIFDGIFKNLEARDSTIEFAIKKDADSWTQIELLRIYHFTWILVRFYVSVDFHRFSLIVIDFHRFSLIAIKFH